MFDLQEFPRRVVFAVVGFGLCGGASVAQCATPVRAVSCDEAAQTATQHAGLVGGVSIARVMMFAPSWLVLAPPIGLLALTLARRRRIGMVERRGCAHGVERT